MSEANNIFLLAKTTAIELLEGLILLEQLFTRFARPSVSWY